MEKFLEYEKGNIFYSIKGEGDALVLLHGFLENHHIWDDFSSELSENFKVIAIDLPGFGQSDNFSEVHSMELMAGVVKDVLDHEAISSCVMAGHSMGGYVSLAFLEQFPVYLKGLILFHSHAAADTDEAKKNRERTVKIVEANKKDFINQFIPDLFAPENVEKYSDVISKLQQHARQVSKEAVIAALHGMKLRKSGIDVLVKSPVPVKFILGKLDSRINFSSALAQAALPFHSEILILDKVGHMGYIEAREITLKSLSCFAKSCFSTS